MAQREVAAAGVSEAEERARDHLRRAQQEADRMQADARQHVADAEDNYRRVHLTAQQVGWSADALADMGYAAPAPPKRSRGRKDSATPDDAPAAAPAATGGGDPSTA